MHFQGPWVTLQVLGQASWQWKSPPTPTPTHSHTHSVQTFPTFILFSGQLLVTAITLPLFPEILNSIPPGLRPRRWGRGVQILQQPQLEGSGRGSERQLSLDKRPAANPSGRDLPEPGHKGQLSFSRESPPKGLQGSPFPLFPSASDSVRRVVFLVYFFLVPLLHGCVSG